MIHRVIILERDRASVDRIIKAKRDTGIDAAMVVATTREACQRRTSRGHDLAFIPDEYLNHQNHALRKIAPDLRFILTTRSPIQDASDNAGSVAVLLEAIRVIQETDYQPPLRVSCLSPIAAKGWTGEN
jgi:hypothetical protein